MNALVVEDQSLMLDVLVYMINCGGWFDSVHTAKDGKSALECYNRYRPEFLLLDVELPKLSGMRIAQYVLKRNPSTKILMLSGIMDEATICGISRLEGISGVLLKQDDVLEDILEIIPRILKGETHYCAGYRDLLRKYTSSGRCLDKILDPIERRIFSLVGAGWDDETIANYLSMKEDTVKLNINWLHQKLCVRDRCELISIAQESGFSRGSWRKMELIDQYDIV